MKLKKEIKEARKRSFEFRMIFNKLQASVKAHISKLDPIKTKVKAIARDMDNQRDRSEFKAYNDKIADNVKMVMAATMVLFEKKIDWLNAKLVVTQPDFIDIIIKFCKFRYIRLEEETVDKLRKYCENPDFDADAIRKDSIVASKICQMIHLIVEYYNVHKEIEDEREEIREKSKEMMMIQSDLETN